MIDNNEFRTLLRELYFTDPCRVLPNALWKTEERLNSLRCSFICIEGELLKLEGYDMNGLHILWNRERRVDQSFINILKRFNFMIIHDDYFQQINTDGYNFKSYFRIKHNNKNILTYCLNNDFYIEEARPEKEYSRISNFIGRCYKDLHPTSNAVESWTTHRVFDNYLWIWIMDKRKKIPAALGIAEFDRSVPEGSLEWIQVIPEYQGRGLGRVLVIELLNRLKGRADFTTVSGEMDNKSNPERLYRSCGFAGNDIWWLLRR